MPEFERVFQQDLSQLLIDRRPRPSVLFGRRKSDPVTRFDGNEYDQVERLHRRPYPRELIIQIDGVRVLMHGYVCQKGHRRAVEQNAVTIVRSEWPFLIQNNAHQPVAHHQSEAPVIAALGDIAFRSETISLRLVAATATILPPCERIPSAHHFTRTMGRDTTRPSASSRYM